MKKRWLFAIIAVMAALAAGWYVFSAVQGGINELNKGQNRAKSAVISGGMLVSADKVTTFNGPYPGSDNKPASYYAVHGINSKGKESVALLPARDLGAKPAVLELSAGITAKQAENLAEKNYSPRKMISSKMGILMQKESRVPVWEVKYIDSYDRYTYDYYEFKTGKLLAHYAVK
ncbi:hypothetical protein CEF21_13895 [Bacillus sp. FJAT-42376]|uniref:hypothetical protein n=1 Tax=Bacillus sp. FJAT-42376 TaxID=2014076 RepID=UPI000F500BF3|nr:hypothetical protein [Bacillus sp. FJAT-42376]AZB43306.1 hypothetical protein CEF21_13895 [Bacillus sp. FJAT-42376]